MANTIKENNVDKARYFKERQSRSLDSNLFTTLRGTKDLIDCIGKSKARKQNEGQYLEWTLQKTQGRSSTRANKTGGKNYQEMHLNPSTSKDQTTLEDS